MSADLFAAFVGTQSSREDSKESVSKPASGLLIDDLSSAPEDTWQSWPVVADGIGEPSSRHGQQSLWESDDRGNNILFDADHASADNDDDFGDFEQVVRESGNHVQHSDSRSTEAYLLDLDSSTPTTFHHLDTTTSRTKQSVVVGSALHPSPRDLYGTRSNGMSDDWGDFETSETYKETVDHPHASTVSRQVSVSCTPKKSTSIAAKPRKTILPVPSDPCLDSNQNNQPEEDLWDEFKDGEPLEETGSQAPRSHAQQKSAGRVPDRPTNIPPPAVLLAWLPGVFAQLAKSARQPETDPMSGTAALQAYRVAARIMAGRASRWKRDTLLAQSMRIGIAGRSGGMKLTVLDKGESRREDQVAEEVVASWTRYSHVLNAAMIRARAPKPAMALSSRLSARAATGLDVVTATHICTVCGLRRNERVMGIDVTVSDTFGEFWMEFWGHKDCADTWYTFNGLLEQR